jgi:hypothetical protein
MIGGSGLSGPTTPEQQISLVSACDIFKKLSFEEIPRKHANHLLVSMQTSHMELGNEPRVAFGPDSPKHV